jgi:hypothetical protein
VKLVLTARETLALYDTLRDRLKGWDVDLAESGGDAELCGPAGAEQHLYQVYDRIRAAVIGSLSTPAPDVVEKFFAREQAKIDALKRQNDEVLREQGELGAQLACSAQPEPSTPNPTRSRRPSKR